MSFIASLLPARLLARAEPRIIVPLPVIQSVFDPRGSSAERSPYTQINPRTSVALEANDPMLSFGILPYGIWSVGRKNVKGLAEDQRLTVAFEYLKGVPPGSEAPDLLFSGMVYETRPDPRRQQRPIPAMRMRLSGNLVSSRVPVSPTRVGEESERIASMLALNVTGLSIDGRILPPTLNNVLLAVTYADLIKKTIINNGVHAPGRAMFFSKQWVEKEQRPVEIGSQRMPVALALA